MALISPRLEAYLALERQMLALDAAGDSLADVLREALDPIWYGLTDEDHALLDARTISSTACAAALRMPAVSDLYLAPPRFAEPLRRRDPLRISGWECAA